MRNRDALRRGVSRLAVALALALCWAGRPATSPATAAELAAPGIEPRRWADFVEPGFPFFGSVVDGRSLGNGLPADNLTPRGLVLNLGHGCWAVFDLELLRVAAVWEGGAVTPVSMSQGSYHTPGRKTPEGQDDLPKPAGTVWLANGIYPGIQAGDRFSAADPRDPGEDPREVGRGRLPRASGRFRAIDIHPSSVTLRYEIGDLRVEETLTAWANEGGVSVRRRLRVGAGADPVWIAVGHLAGVPPGGDRARVAVESRQDGEPPVVSEGADGLVVVRVPGSAASREIDLWLERGGDSRQGHPASPIEGGDRERRRWPDTIVTRGILAPSVEAYAVDRVPLPTDNPWRRNVRFADLALRPDGPGYGVTFDGDIWSVTGLGGDLADVRWRRFTSGLHEPLGLAIRDGEVFAHDRNGLWRIRDQDGDGEADLHELFADGVPQTAETREFASGLKVRPGGAFVIGKGGQRGVTLGRHSGSVLEISADGERVTVLGHGFRQPFIGVHPTEGWVSVSDQQGHYIPTTALHILAGDAHHGFVPLILPKGIQPEPIEEPLLWIPHAINASAAGQVWLEGTEMGPLSGGLIHLGYYRPEVFAVLLNRKEPRAGAAVVSLTRDLDFAPLAGVVGPVDGQLYVTGFQIWGTTAKEISGLARIRYTGREFPLPTAVKPKIEGVLIRFAVELDPAAAVDPGNYSLERWNYERSAAYGSAHYRSDGSKGQDRLVASSAYLSRDGRSVFVGVPGMAEAMQLRVGWALRTREGASLARSAYLTPRRLERFDPRAGGFDPVPVDLTPRVEREQGTRNDGPRDAAEGRRVAELMGCVACHSADGSTLGKVGPTWKGLWGSRRTFMDATTLEVDAAYLRESMREPLARVVAGYGTSDTGMPSYDGVLTEAQMEALIRYIETLR